MGYGPVDDKNKKRRTKTNEPASEINRGRGKRGKRKIIDFDVEFVEPYKVSEKPKKRPRSAGVNVKSYVELSDEDDEDNEE
ncbi:hypothetical protein C1645_881908 [Glomus cerebriforme]|uniref:Uncharacterized protein n=1 Tax=Glomus cerebriforme TaxID=658196 RepID=A0A397S3B5_9GLOM|nr:hypothetical protein C1645_881908 [Glomus cerebriforme]